MTKSGKKICLLVAVIMALFADGPARAAGDKPLAHARLQLPWVMLGAYDPFTLALQRGYYRDQGIDLTINEGNSSLVAAQTVATGTSEFAYTDAGTGATLISKGAKIRFIAVMQRKSALGMIYHPPFELKQFTDLKGRQILHGANDAPTQMFVALLAKHGMSWDDVKSVIISPSSYAQSFLQNKDAVLLGNTYSTFQSIITHEPTAKTRFFSDFGVNLMSSGLLTSDDIIQKNPDLARGFLAASIHGFQDALKDPGAAVDSAAKTFPMAVKAKEAINRGELMAALAILNTPETDGKPLGWTSEAQWASMIELLKTYAGMKTDLTPTAFYTNDFLPAN